MRRILLAPLLAISIALAGCASAPGGGTTVTLPTITLPSISPGVDATITQVQTIATKACGFLPAAETVAGLIGTFTGVGPAVGIASSIADAICRAVSKPGLRRGARALPVLHGVQIRGSFVQR